MATSVAAGGAAGAGKYRSVDGRSPCGRLGRNRRSHVLGTAGAAPAGLGWAGLGWSARHSRHRW